MPRKQVLGVRCCAHLHDVCRCGTGEYVVHHAARADVVEADGKATEREPVRDVPPHGTGKVVATHGRVQQAVLHDAMQERQWRGSHTAKCCDTHGWLARRKLTVSYAVRALCSSASSHGSHTSDASDAAPPAAAMASGGKPASGASDSAAAAMTSQRAVRWARMASFSDRSTASASASGSSVGGASGTGGA